MQVQQVFKNKTSTLFRKSFVEKMKLLTAVRCSFKTVKYIVVHLPKGLM